MMSDAILVALIGAIFNAGVQWATIKFLVRRVERLEKKAFGDYKNA